MASTKSGSKTNKAKIQNKIQKIKQIVSTPAQKVGRKQSRSMKSGPQPNVSRLKESFSVSAVDNISTNPSYFSSLGKVRSSDSEFPGEAFGFSQPFTAIATTATDSNLFVASSLATITSGNLIMVTPDILNGTVAAEAANWVKYRFTKLRFIFSTSTPTTVGNSMAWGILPYTGDQPTSFGETRMIIPSVTVPFRCNGEISINTRPDGPLYTCLIDVATNAGGKLTVQYLFCGWPQAASIGAISYGYIQVEGIIELFDRAQNQGFTMRNLLRNEKLMLEAALLSFRSKSTDPGDPLLKQGQMTLKNHYRDMFGDLSQTDYDMIRAGKKEFRLTEFLTSDSTIAARRLRDPVPAANYPININITNDIFEDVGGQSSIRSAVVKPTNLIANPIDVFVTNSSNSSSSSSSSSSNGNGLSVSEPRLKLAMRMTEVNPTTHVPDGIHTIDRTKSRKTFKFPELSSLQKNAFFDTYQIPGDQRLIDIVDLSSGFYSYTLFTGGDSPEAFQSMSALTLRPHLVVPQEDIII
jgi:hypothetical protein